MTGGGGFGRVNGSNGKEFAKKFTLACQKLGIKHKRTKIKHPCLPAEALAQAGTNGQVETTIKQIKQQTIWKIYYPDYQVLAKNLTVWVNNYNLKTCLRSIGGLTPAEKVLQYYQSLTEEKQKQRFLKKSILRVFKSFYHNLVKLTR